MGKTGTIVYGVGRASAAVGQRALRKKCRPVRTKTAPICFGSRETTYRSRMVRPTRVKTCRRKGFRQAISQVRPTTDSNSLVLGLAVAASGALVQPKDKKQ